MSAVPPVSLSLSHRPSISLSRRRAARRLLLSLTGPLSLSLEGKQQVGQRRRRRRAATADRPASTSTASSSTSDGEQQAGNPHLSASASYILDVTPAVHLPLLLSTSMAAVEAKTVRRMELLVFVKEAGTGASQLSSGRTAVSTPTAINSRSPATGEQADNPHLSASASFYILDVMPTVHLPPLLLSTSPTTVEAKTVQWRRRWRGEWRCWCLLKRPALAFLSCRGGATSPSWWGDSMIGITSIMLGFFGFGVGVSPSDVIGYYFFTFF